MLLDPQVILSLDLIDHIFPHLKKWHESKIILDSKSHQKASKAKYHAVEKNGVNFYTKIQRNVKIFFHKWWGFEK